MAYQGTLHKLNTGASIPAIGFGTWQIQEPAISSALKSGYRHLDTASIYGSEPAVAEAIKKSGIPRSELFVTTKLWNDSHHPDDVEAALEASLKNIGIEYVDLYLMHYPSSFARGSSSIPKDKDGKIIPGDVDYVDTWKAMEKLFKSGKAKAIGVSNFSKAELERLIEKTSVVPAVHQFELHPYLAQKEFFEWHTSKGIHVTQYSPFGNQNEMYDKGKNTGKLIDDPTLAAIGKKYNKSGSQTALAWGINHGRTVVPRSKTPSRIQQNLEGDFKLEDADLHQIDALDRKWRLNDPSQSFGWEFFTDLDGK